MKRVFSIAVVIIASAVAVAPASEIGFVEDFALAKDRPAALKQLIPGTEDYYYYHCLHFQNVEQFDQVDEILKAWIKRHNYTARVYEILNRQALLRYGDDPDKTLAYLREKLNLHFNHQRETLGQKPNLPSELNQERIGRKALTERALAQHRNLQGFENTALDWLVAAQLDPDRRRHLLQRMTRPDYSNLAKLVVDDLKYRNSRGFGSFNIHRQLLKSQLDECLELHPALLNQNNFVNTYLTKLHPDNDVDWQHDDKAQSAHLDRLWNFVQRLAPVHNSLKAHVLFHRLVFDRRQGVYDKDRFMTYIKLPRQAGYVNPRYLENQENRRYACNLNANYQSVTLLPPVGNDEPLVRGYLHHFFVEENYRQFEAYLHDDYLKHNYAETKIVLGLGDSERWYSMLPPEKYQALKERVDIDFAHTNTTVFAADEPVKLDLHVKNVKTLIVKVYEINTRNFYRQQGREIDTDINLDGLVPHEEKIFNYGEAPLRRVDRQFEFPSCGGRGVYVLDFIGNGKSSRALVRKGRLRHLARTSSAGHVITVLDERNRKQNDASVWLAGRQYEADDKGAITVPYSNRPGTQPIVLSSGNFSSLDYLNHQSENYSLRAGIYVDRESLLNRRQANVVVRPGLFVNGTPVSLSVLEEVQLVITSTDLDGIATTKEMPGFKLFEDRESVHEFQVPQRLAQIHFTLKAKIQNLSQNKKIDLAASTAFSLNQIDRSDKIEDLHLAKIAGSYSVDVFGKTGEPKPDRPVHLKIKHRDFVKAVDLTLQSDNQGRIALGKLADILWVQATGPEGTSQKWNLLTDEYTYHSSIHGRVGEPVELPYLGDRQEPARAEISLLELRGGTFVADRFKSVSIEDGMLSVEGLPAGDYDLLLKPAGPRIRLRLTAGKRQSGYALGNRRQLEIRGDKPLVVKRIETGDEIVRLHLGNSSKFCRVHVFATRFEPAYPMFGHLSQVRDPEPFVVTASQAETLYLAGRNIGDEYRYIIDRKYAKKLPGNMLERPSLLLNPWAIRSTQTGEQLAEAGQDFESRGGNQRGESKRDGEHAPGQTQQSVFANLDFLSQASVALLNLVPDENGIIELDRNELGGHQRLHVVAVDPRGTTYRSVSLDETKQAPYDLRLAKGLDPDGHFTQQKQISIVKADGEFVLADITTSKFEAYDSLAKVYSLYTTLSGDAKLREFAFIMNWPELSAEEKQEQYSKFACHELTFFVYKKDPEFFRDVVVPYLENKKDKTFLDQWFLQAEVNGHLQPWNHARLNIVERILLGQRIEDERPHTERHVTDLFDLLPPDIDRFNFLFRTSIKGHALDANDELGLEGAIRDRAKASLFSINGSAPAAPRTAAPAPAGGGGESRNGPPSPDAIPAPASEPNVAALRDMEERSAALDDLVKDKDASREEAAKQLGRANKKSAARFFADEKKNREAARQLYRKLDKTQEWVENNYYKLAIEQQNANLVSVNAFWRDYALHTPGGQFFSTNLADASHNFTEMMLALSVLDLPFEAEDHESTFEENKMVLKPGSPMIVFHEEIRPTKDEVTQTPILISQNFFQNADRYRHENNQRLDKYVTEEFLVHTVYGCQVVVTNPTSTPQKLDVLLQLPIGSMPVAGSQFTRSVHIDLQPYHTRTVEYHFYFPKAGDFDHYPVHVARNQKLLAFAEPFAFHVVDEPSKLDRESWDYVSQHGSSEDVLGYLKKHNLNRTNLDRIAFRMADKRFFRTTVELLAMRHVYNHTLWSYGIKHDHVAAIGEYLQHADGFVNRCGSWLDSPLLTINPVVRKTYQHMDYRPLVNARTHQLGRRRQILNNRFAQQYDRLLKIFSCKRELDDDDLMAATYYLLLQDRVDEAFGYYEQVDADKLATRMQYDYFTAYLDLFQEDPTVAERLTEQYADHPVDRWRNAFAAVANQLEEINGGAAAVIDEEDRNQIQTNLAATQANFDLKVEAKEIKLEYQNLKQVVVNYYLMDVELLFSRNPFVQQDSSRFSLIRPNRTETVELPADKSTLTIALPKAMHSSNVLVEITGDGQTKSQAYYANSLSLQLVENYGQLRVSHDKTAKSIPKTYVKVYARMKNGKVQFYKDGYTDLRGRFDYTSLNTNELDFVESFALLVLSDQHGAIVREAKPPKQ